MSDCRVASWVQHPSGGTSSGRSGGRRHVPRGRRTGWAGMVPAAMVLDAVPQEAQEAALEALSYQAEPMRDSSSGSVYFSVKLPH